MNEWHAIFLDLKNFVYDFLMFTDLALLAHGNDGASWPIFGAIFRANTSSTEPQIVVACVFFDGWQVRWNFQFIRWTEMPKCTWWQFPYQALLWKRKKIRIDLITAYSAQISHLTVRHTLRSIIVGENFHDCSVSVKESAVWNLRERKNEFKEIINWKFSSQRRSFSTYSTQFLHLDCIVDKSTDLLLCSHIEFAYGRIQLSAQHHQSKLRWANANTACVTCKNLHTLLQVR